MCLTLPSQAGEGNIMSMRILSWTSPDGRRRGELLKMAHDVGVKLMADEDGGAYDCVTLSHPWIPTLTRR